MATLLGGSAGFRFWGMFLASFFYFFCFLFRGGEEESFRFSVGQRLCFVASCADRTILGRMQWTYDTKRNWGAFEVTQKDLIRKENPPTCT